MSVEDFPGNARCIESCRKFDLCRKMENQGLAWLELVGILRGEDVEEFPDGDQTADLIVKTASVDKTDEVLDQYHQIGVSMRDAGRGLQEGLLRTCEAGGPLPGTNICQSANQRHIFFTEQDIEY